MKRKDLRIEAEFLPDDLDQLAQLRRRLLAAGHPPPFANGLCSWLLAKRAGDPDVTGPATRSRYRKALTELPGSPKPRRTLGDRRAAARRREAGRSDQRTLVAVAGGGATMLALAPVVGPVPAAAAALYVTRNPAEEVPAAA